jgi:hypothetical protein
MKNILLVATFLSFAGLTFAQKDVVGDLFSKYSGTQGITVVNITGDMLKLMMDAQQQKQDTVFSSKLSEVRVLAVEKGCDKPATLDFRSEVYDKLDKSLYKEMISIKQNEEDVKVLLRESNGRIAEVLVIIGGASDNALIQVKGDMLLSELEQMAGKYQMKGFEHLKRMEKE